VPPLLEEMQAGLAGRYTLERELGRGGMATVFLARDVRHGRNVAIKVLNPDIANAVGAARFSQEIHLAANLIHPHILPLLDSGEVPVEGGPSRLWYATPFVAGDSLRARLSRERQLPVAEAVRIAVEIADALDYAHRQGFLHRDIKPENVLLQDGHALVADLGIGRAIDHDGERLTGSGLLLGTPAYMSPEQAGGAALDGRTDVYSLGCVLYEMLTGSPAFSGPTPAAIVGRILSSTPPPVRETRPAAAALDPILRKAMAPVPADRFASGREFANALSETAPAVRTVAEPEVRGRQSAARTRLLPALGLLVALAGGWWAWSAGLFATRGAPGGLGEGGVPTIAVLPIEIISERAERDRAFAEAMHVPDR
jgi:serine/threonine-protein kinase